MPLLRDGPRRPGPGWAIQGRHLISLQPESRRRWLGGAVRSCGVHAQAEGVRSLPGLLQHTGVSWPFFNLGSLLCAAGGRLQEAAPLWAPSHGLGSWGRGWAGSRGGRPCWGPRREMHPGLLLFPHRPALNCCDFNY